MHQYFNDKKKENSEAQGLVHCNECKSYQDLCCLTKHISPVSVSSRSAYSGYGVFTGSTGVGTILKQPFS